MVMNILGVAALCSGGGKCGNGFNIRTSREFVDLWDSGASGKADIVSITTNNGLNNVKITITARGLEPFYKAKCNSCKNVYEVWLIDKDSPYGLSLGAFTPNRAGKVFYIFQQKQVNFLVYDYLAIAEKPMNSFDPFSGDVVLLADITGSSGI